jgi:hypothetical protein
LSICKEENYRLEKSIGSLKEKIEDCDKLKEKLDHRKGEVLLTIEKLNKFEKGTEKLDEILNSQRYPNENIGI